MTARKADLAALALALGLAFSPPAFAGDGDLANDYPTEARADYVFACMAANGQTREALHKCSCSQDVLSSILPYDRYVEAETVLSMRQGVGFTVDHPIVGVRVQPLAQRKRGAKPRLEPGCVGDLPGFEQSRTDQ